jgi:hypothetical protein
MTDSGDFIPEDEIAKWAENLTPEGSPGEVASVMRKFLGDQGYERAVAQNELLTDMHIVRQDRINRILGLIVVYGNVFGVLGAGVLLALIIRNIFG